VAQRWTKGEKLAVFNGVGVCGWASLQRGAGDSYEDPDLPEGRSKEAVRRQIRRMAGSGARRGSISLRKLAEVTGYHPSQLRRAQKALNQSWQRMSKRGAHLISEEQVLDIVAWLLHDFWNASKRLYCCIWCSTSSRPHRSGGLCNRCFWKYRRKCLENGIPAALKDQRQIVMGMFLDCAHVDIHGKFLEEARSRLDSGLALTENLLDWLVTTYDRKDNSGTNSR
jgi:hypothetical protein